MLYFHAQKLVFLEVPKTGSSAVVSALGDLAAMQISRPPGKRHMNAGVFNGRPRAFIRQFWGGEVETFAVMREPVDRLVSWYRYLQRPAQPEGPDSTHDISFDDFVAAALSGDPRFPGIGRQDRFLMGEGTRPLVTHIFQYDRQDLLAAFLDARFNRAVSFERVNVSTGGAVEVTDAVREAVRAARPDEARLWDRVAREGYLHSPGA
ncbi:sulfotransferase family 2 domain-containing protein [Sinisalibacter lacisalsi]|uniref:Gamma-glutamyl kinase n=1 Tax=Sinisalibacter lacisalsi TaxID=1526570 RepID=A0ABQ1QJE2_9RHOB|nr:sulfotransferase family 2 domain-containing protein [Sinisalibacter lacisalsi]GGD26944.1 gamma-glutamyl kinase [Sinisalibacter lacisalsi]